jgi:hypothetical protein
MLRAFYAWAYNGGVIDAGTFLDLRRVRSPEAASRDATEYRQPCLTCRVELGHPKRCYDCLRLLPLEA